MEKTLTIGTRIYTLKDTGKEAIPYKLVGPRGGELLVTRNINDQSLHVMGHNNQVIAKLTDKNGTLELVGQ